MKFVLRKKPAGQLLSNTAHQIEREYTMLRALHNHNTSPSTTPEQVVPVPEPIILCEDRAVIGTPFYVMEFLDGRIFTDTRMLEVPPQDRREWYVNTYLTANLLTSCVQLVVCYSGSCSSRYTLTSCIRTFQLRALHKLFSSTDQIVNTRFSRAGCGRRH